MARLLPVLALALQLVTLPLVGEVSPFGAWFAVGSETLTAVQEKLQPGMFVAWAEFRLLPMVTVAWAVPAIASVAATAKPSRRIPFLLIVFILTRDLLIGCGG